MQNKKIKVLMAAAEAAPFAKVGGLADVVGSLPLALAKLNCDVRVILPFYGGIERSRFNFKIIARNIKFNFGREEQTINVWQASLKGSKVIFYFIESKYFAAKEIYKPEKNDTSTKRFLFFSQAVLESLLIIKFQPDIIHCHDFHTAMIIDLVKAGKYDYLKKTKTVYTIHNLNYQGLAGSEILSVSDLNKESLASLGCDIQDGDINFMAQGIMNADAVTTVSKTYAEEIGTIEYGAGLEKIINTRKIYGVVNGLDIKLFNPAADKLIAKKYSVKTLKNKAINKTNLQQALGFKAEENLTLVGMVTRISWQKGFDLFSDRLLQLPLQLIILGTGESGYEDKLNQLAKKYPDKFKFKNYFDLQLAQQIYASADIFLMPSQFEPCGLGQMIAMRYGTVPVVRATGGLDDTVNSKVGFKFKEFTEDALMATLQTAIKTFTNKNKWTQLQQNCMQQDFSWDKSANEYSKIYKKLLSF